MGEWLIGALINLFGSITINFGTNLLKLGHMERERHLMLSCNDTNDKGHLKRIIYFRTWRIGILFFFIGNCLNFISFGYTAQSLLAALGSVQFISNIAFAYLLLNKMVTVKVYVATAFIVMGNIFLVAFGNHQSPVYTSEELVEKYSNTAFLLYCMVLIAVVVFHQYIYRRGQFLLSIPGQELQPYWRTLLPFSYAVVSGAIGSCSVLFAKSISNLLRLSTSQGYLFHSWFTYCMLFLFFGTAGFWMTRLNEGLALFDAILIVPMFQIVWTFFSICTGFVYFQEYQIFNTLRTTMFVFGLLSLFVGISLLPPQSRGESSKQNSSVVSVMSSSPSTEAERLVILSEDYRGKNPKSLGHGLVLKTGEMIATAKNALLSLIRNAEGSVNPAMVYMVPLVSSKIAGFGRNSLERPKI